MSVTNKKGKPVRQHSQRGAAALLVTTLLVVIGGLSALVVNEAMVTEQKITGSNLRNKEAYAAAISGLDYAIEWLENTGVAGITWSTVGGVVAAGSTAQPPALADSAEGVDSYDHTLTYELLTDLDVDPKLMRVTSTVEGVADSHVQKTVSVIVIRAALISGTAYKGPPLLVEECVSNVTGTPDIVPNGSLNLAIGTVNGTTACLDPGNFELNGGDVAELDAPAPDLFSTIFGVGRDESDVQSWAAANPANIIYVDSNYSGSGLYSFNGNKWGVSLGSATNDVILYFDDSVGCPKINGGGGVEIYGLVYFEQQDCSSQGWGAATIHGTVAFSGDLTKFTANTELIGDALDSFGGDDSTFSVVSIVPGSWRDF
jgi:hypothetical protein